MAKATADIRSLARAQTALAIRTLTGICGSKAAPAAARVSAASALLDRGWGRAAQPHAGADGEGAIEIILRNVIDEKRRQGLMSVCAIQRPAPAAGPAPPVAASRRPYSKSVHDRRREAESVLIEHDDGCDEA